MFFQSLYIIMMWNVTTEKRSGASPAEHQYVSINDRSLFGPVLHELPQGKHSDLRLMYKYCEETKRGTQDGERWKKWRGGWYLTNVQAIHSALEEVSWSFEQSGQIMLHMNCGPEGFPFLLYFFLCPKITCKELHEAFKTWYLQLTSNLRAKLQLEAVRP